MESMHTVTMTMQFSPLKDSVFDEFIPPNDENVEILSVVGRHNDKHFIISIWSNQMRVDAQNTQCYSHQQNGMECLCVVDKTESAAGNKFHDKSVDRNSDDSILCNRSYKHDIHIRKYAWLLTLEFLAPTAATHQNVVINYISVWLVEPIAVWICTARQALCHLVISVWFVSGIPGMHDGSLRSVHNSHAA